MATVPPVAVQVKPGADVTEDEIKAHAARQLASFKLPVRIDVRTTELPKNASGKTLKTVLRDELIAIHGKAKFNAT